MRPVARRPFHGADTVADYAVAGRLTLSAPCRWSAWDFAEGVQVGAGLLAGGDSVRLLRLLAPPPKRDG